MNAVRAVGLLSGGLDSALAARLLVDQGIEVIGLHLQSPTACRTDVHEVARDLGIRLEVRDKGEAYLRLLRNPRWGYGRNMNPCVDCRLFMFRLGEPLLEEFGAAFLFSGEVLGQRPMSQTRDKIERIDRESGLAGRILRPLSALLLPETEAETRGWVDRSRLLGLSGRSRHAQLALAARLGLRHYQSPGGGCLLTDAAYSERLRDLFAHVPEEATAMDDVALLSIGRHFRIDAGLKVVLGRNAEENGRLPGYARDDRWLVAPLGFNGPAALVCGPRDDASLGHAMALIARYSRDPAPGAEVGWQESGTMRRRRLDAGAIREDFIPLHAL